MPEAFYVLKAAFSIHRFLERPEKAIRFPIGSLKPYFIIILIIIDLWIIWIIMKDGFRDPIGKRIASAFRRAVQSH